MGRQQRNAKKEASSAKQAHQKSAESPNTVTRTNCKRTSTISGRGQNAQEKGQKTRSLTTKNIPAIVKAVVDVLPASRQDGAIPEDGTVPEDGSTERGQQTTDGDSGEQRDSREQSQHEEFGECLSLAIYYVRTY